MRLPWMPNPWGAQMTFWTSTTGKGGEGSRPGWVRLAEAGWWRSDVARYGCYIYPQRSRHGYIWIDVDAAGDV